MHIFPRKYSIHACSYSKFIIIFEAGVNITANCVATVAISQQSGSVHAGLGECMVVPKLS